MKKIITLTLALILAFSLAACSFEFGGGTSGGGDPTNSKPTSGDTAQTPGDTSKPPNGETSKPPTDPPSVGDPVAVNALVGTWGVRGYSTYYYWTFAEDGRFAYSYVSYVASPRNRYEQFIKGKYRANGSTIELYDCQYDYDSGITADFKYFGTLLYNEFPSDILLVTPLKDAKKTDNFTVKFEFIDTMNLRIIIDRSMVDKYDMDFVYMDKSHNVTIPTHSLPSVAWPKDLLPSECLEYVDGRIRKVDTTSNAGEVRITIDRTTKEAYIRYFERLVQSGWKDNNPDYLVSFKQGGSEHGVYLEMGKYNFKVQMKPNGTVELVYW